MMYLRHVEHLLESLANLLEGSPEELSTLEGKLHALADTLGKKLSSEADELGELVWSARSMWGKHKLSDSDALEFLSIALLLTSDQKDSPEARHFRREIESSSGLEPLLNSVRGAKAVKLRVKRDPARFITITKSVRGDATSDGPWQVTWFDNHIGGHDSPSGHSNAKSIEAAIREAWNMWGRLEVEEMARTQNEARELLLGVLTPHLPGLRAEAELVLEVESRAG